MVKSERAGASIAASATNENVWQSERFVVAPYPRIIKALAVASTANTPAISELTWQLFAGQQLLAEGESILEAAGGATFKMPDDYSAIDVRVPANTPMVLRVTNTDAGAAHTPKWSLIMDLL